MIQDENGNPRLRSRQETLGVAGASTSTRTRPLDGASTSTQVKTDGTSVVTATTILANGNTQTTSSSYASLPSQSLLSSVLSISDAMGRTLETTNGRGHVMLYTYHGIGGQLASTTQINAAPGGGNLVTSHAFAITVGSGQLVTTMLPDGIKLDIQNLLALSRHFRYSLLMGYARRLIVPDGEDCVVHAISRCVRQAWLCGRDAGTGKDYEHRRGWVKERIRYLAGVFAVEVCAYAVMSNHSHMVLWCRPSVAASWSAEEVARRWLMVFGPRKRVWTEAEIAGFAKDDKEIAKWRERLGSMSWFMRCLNEYIARLANKEDGCKGRFWEGRFRSQLLADDGAVLACMAYVDLNPVRAKMAANLQESEYTSVFDRITGKRGRAKVEKIQDALLRPPGYEGQGKTQDSRGEKNGQADDHGSGATGKMPVEHTDELAKAREEAVADAWLCPMGEAAGRHTVLGMTLDGYLALIEWTVQALRADKRGALPKEMMSLLGQLDLDVAVWVETVREFGRIYHRVAGREESLRAKARGYGQRWVAGVKSGRGVYRAAAVG